MMNKKDEALKKCLRVLEPISEQRMYETQWIGSAIQACKEALEQPTQEPVAFRNKNTGEFCTGGFLLNHGWDKEWIKLYTHPKEWQGLSDEEIVSVFKSGADHITGDLLINFAKAIEQKLKEKNHGTT